MSFNILKRQKDLTAVEANMTGSSSLDLNATAMDIQEIQDIVQHITAYRN